MAVTGNVISLSLQQRKCAGGSRAPASPGLHGSTPKSKQLIQSFPSGFEYSLSPPNAQKESFTGKFSTIPTNPQVQRVFKEIERGLSELTLGISAGLRKDFQKLILLKAAHTFFLSFSGRLDLIFDHS